MIYDEYDQINSTDDKSIYNYTIECLDRNGDEIDSYQFSEEKRKISGTVIVYNSI